MIGRRVDLSQYGKLWTVLAGFVIILYVLWQLSNSIAAGSPKLALLIVAVFAAFFVVGRIANDWRSGVSLFFIWLTFEDLIRKYMGNSMVIYFAKDVMVGVTYMSFLVSGSRRDAMLFIRRSDMRSACSFFWGSYSSLTLFRRVSFTVS